MSFSFVSGKWTLVLQSLSQFGLVSIVDIFFNVCVMTSYVKFVGRLCVEGSTVNCRLVLCDVALGM